MLRMGSSESFRARSRERLLRLCAGGMDADVLRQEVVAELRRSIGFAVWGWPLADPDTLLATTGIADSAVWPIVARLVACEEGSDDLNKDRTLATGDPVGILSDATRGSLACSKRWREILGPFGFGDELRMACVDRYGCWGHLRLYRQAGDRSFTQSDADLMRVISPALASALRKSSVRAASVRASEPLTAGIVILDDDLGLRSWTRDAGQWFEAFAGDAPPRGANARCAVYSAASRYLANERMGAGVAARARLRLGDGRWVVAEANRLAGENRGIAVTVRGAATSDVLDVLVRAHGLAPRERELVSSVLEGLDTTDIARRLSISRNTVQQHLKAIFFKVGVRGRRQLLAGIFGTRA